MNKKLFLALAMALLALLLVVGCGGGSNQPSQEPQTPPADSQPAESEPAQSEPAQSEPAASEPAESEAAESEPADSKPAEEAKPADEKPAEEAKPADSKPAEEAKPEQKEEASAGGGGSVGAVDGGKCTSCHGSLDNAIASIDGHPQMPMDSLASCAPCHSSGSMALKEVMHSVGSHSSLGCNSCHQ